jgi:23S rRNA (cytosine1962-C5)-methyltransferase
VAKSTFEKFFHKQKISNYSMSITTLKLKPNEERRLLAGHLWIYSNEVDVAATPLKNFKLGELVKIVSARDQELGLGYINPKNLLCVRLLTRKVGEKINADFFATRIESALILRERCFQKPFYRLLFAESDFLPGLIVDRFADILVAQITTAGLENLKSEIITALKKTLNPKTIILRNDSKARENEGLTLYTEVVYGEAPDLIYLEENGAQFHAPTLVGQKTGWFFDQRQNRASVLKYVAGKKILDAFSYLGGFGITAAVHGANEVLCIDASEKATDLIKENASLNHVAERVKTINADVAETLKSLARCGETFDLVVLDPPAFIKKQKDFKTGSIAYQNLQELALQLLPAHGLLATFSCSMHMSRDDLLDAVRKASLKIKRPIHIIEELHQAQDHPIHPAIYETNYLKGFILEVL